jgi:hypothetical protein
MSVVVTIKIGGDTAKFQQALVDKSGAFEAAGERARAGGCLRHQFAMGDGFILVVDEWTTAAGFEEFFADPELMKLVGESGADLSTPPQITIAEAIASPEQM